MVAQHQRIQQRLKGFDFAGLFTQELMWNHFPIRPLEIPVDGTVYRLTPVAQRGMAVFECVPPTDAQFPKYADRRKIDTQVSKTAREHIIIFHDHAKSVQVWQWVKREAGKPSACREQLYYAGQSGDALVQKIQGIAFGLEDEANVAETVSKVGAAFDVEKVTKRFYDLFKKEHDVFLKFTKGIPDDKLQRWYASVMLNRLMFIYFIQKKEFLAGNPHYLTNKLDESKRLGKDRYYRGFLCPLFFEGFAQREEQRSADTNRLLGHVPYLNGGLFLKHQIEELHGTHIEIPDKAFERIFEFFEQYDWHLDDRPTRTGREINPDVLGYVFEKYINQKEMGAYYTKEDITDYIAKNTVIPVLFDMALRSCKIAFEGEHSVWRLLQSEPDRYIHAAMLKGVDKKLPEQIVAGLEDVSRRGDWNKAAGPDYGLPTETWREVVARRTRCKESRENLASGQIRSINDLVVHNLDSRRFAEEVIANSEGPELLRAFYKGLRSISVLDPTCGSGAFLFAALNVLERLYDTCLVRMQGFLDDLDRSGEKHSPEKFSDFRKILGEMNDKQQHPSPHYFILKSIILRNLYGVDIMEEATEICKLRLFLKLVAQMDVGEKIEPLPDIDFNIRSGNSLVGFTTEKELQHAVTNKFDFDNEFNDIRERAEQAENAYQRFREMQVKHGMDPAEFTEAKSEVRERLTALREELDQYLCGEYGINPKNTVAFERWRNAHQPFHWFVEFFGILKSGGFDAVIGNPPYIVYPNKNVNYRVLEPRFETISTRNLYAYVFEQSVKLTSRSGLVGLIVQLTVMSSERVEPLQTMLQRRGTAIFVPFPRRPESVFTDVEMPVAIVISTPRDVNPGFITSNVNRFYSEERPQVADRLHFVQHDIRKGRYRIAKIGSPLEAGLWKKIGGREEGVLGSLACSDSKWLMYYQEACRYWVKAIHGAPFFKRNGKRMEPPHGRTICFVSQAASSFATCLLNSSLFYWMYSVMCDCEHINDSFVREFSVPVGWDCIEWPGISTKLMASLTEHATRKTISTKQGHKIEYDEIKALHSKPVIDEIDTALAKIYGLTPDELQFVLNYDIKYRAGSDVVEEPEDAVSAAGN
jgi:hypothetical protein